MSSKINFLIVPLVALIGSVAFFIPWLGYEMGRMFSGYDLMNQIIESGRKQAVLAILLPISFLIIVLIRLFLIYKMPKVLIKAFDTIPFLMIIGFCLFFIYKMGFEFQIIKLIVEVFWKNVMIGPYITLLCSLILIFSPISKKLDHLSIN